MVKNALAQLEPSSSLMQHVEYATEAEECSKSESLADHRQVIELNRSDALEHGDVNLNAAVTNHLLQLSSTMTTITAESFCHQVPTVDKLVTCQKVQGLFQEHADASCVVICDELGKPTGLLMRDVFFKLLAGRFAADLFYDKPAYDYSQTDLLILETSTPARELIDAALKRGAEAFHSNLILTRQGVFEGVVTVYDLMVMSRELQRETDTYREVIIDEICSLIQEIEASVREVSASSEESFYESEEMSGLSALGRKELEAVYASFSHVLTLMKHQQELIHVLLHRADEISSITGAIRELADQSGILGINASIEAAHAGEYGAGFAIVAEEIRKLALKTKQFSTDIGVSLEAISCLVKDAASATLTTSSEMQSSYNRIDLADQTFKRLVDSARSVEQKGKKMLEISSVTSKKTNIALQELRRLRTRGLYDKSIPTCSLQMEQKTLS